MDGVLVIEPPTVFEDFRGRYVEAYNRELYFKHGIKQDFVQDDFSISHRHVLKGFHGDAHTWKLISCPHGKFQLVVLNWDEGSPQYRKWQSFMLSDSKNAQVLVPPKFGTAHLVMSELAIYFYKQTSYYDVKSQFTIPWNDPELGVWWPVKDPITSLRDKGFNY